MLGPTLHRPRSAIRKKISLTGWEAVYALPRSTHSCWQNDLLMHIWGVETDENSMEQGQSCIVNVPRFKSGADGVFQYGDTHCCTTTQHFWHLPLALTPNHQLLLVTQHLMILNTVYCHTPFLTTFKDWSLRISEQCEYSFSHWSFKCELLNR
jgi:hypothetical protein